MMSSKKRHYFATLSLSLLFICMAGAFFFWLPARPRTVVEFQFLNDYEMVLTAKEISGGPSCGLYFHVSHDGKELVPTKKVDTWDYETLKNINFDFILDKKNQCVAIINKFDPQPVYIIYCVKNNELWLSVSGQDHPMLQHFQDMFKAESKAEG